MCKGKQFDNHECLQVGLICVTWRGFSTWEIESRNHLFRIIDLLLRARVCTFYSIVPELPRAKHLIGRMNPVGKPPKTRCDIKMVRNTNCYQDGAHDVKRTEFSEQIREKKALGLPVMNSWLLAAAIATTATGCRCKNDDFFQFSFAAIAAIASISHS